MNSVKIPAVRRAARKGDLKAQLHLAASLAVGDGVKKDEVEAARWYAAAAAQGSGVAAFNLATMCERGEGVQKNLRKAHLLYKKAEKLGSGDASVTLGTRVLLAKASKGPSIVAALNHFARAALNRDVRGLFLIAQTLSQHPQVTQEDLVTVLLRASAWKGNKEAERYLRSLARNSRPHR